MTSATDKLRRLLDERGIEWSSPELRPNQTRLPYVKFEPWGEGTLKLTIFNLTHEQAIAATLGRGMCEMDMLDTGNEAAYEHYEYIVQAAEWAIDKNGNSLYQGCEEIVRCRDCKYSSNNKECMRPDEWVSDLWFPIESNGFCKWGEKKEGGE